MSPQCPGPGPGRARLPCRVPACCTLLAVLALLSCPAVRAQTQMYVCTDRTGHTHAERYPPPECKDRDVRELNPDGSLKRVIAAPLTKEQRKKREEEEEVRLREEEQERAQLHRDRALLETYGSVDEIDSARRRDLAGRQMLIDRADQRIAQYERERKRLEDEAEFYQHRELPADLRDKFAANKALVQQQEKTRADAQLEMQKINERYDTEKHRYQELEDMARKAAEEREREAAQQQ
ncbi:conserved exported hypothetical protein [Burkholderiales bacterium]|nr:conserved exported hypothetical protein [Burkholderiales bacterium]